MGERCVRNAEVEGSTPFASTSIWWSEKVVSILRNVTIFQRTERHGKPAQGLTFGGFLFSHLADIAGQRDKLQVAQTVIY